MNVKIIFKGEVLLYHRSTQQSEHVAAELSISVFTLILKGKENKV